MPVNVESELARFDVAALLNRRRERAAWPVAPQSRALLLTGFTGHVGSHLCAALQAAFPQATILLLIRARGSASAAERMRDTIAYYELEAAIDQARLRVVDGDLSKPKLGMNDEDWNLCSTVESIVHW